MSDALLVFCTVPDTDTAGKLATTVVADRLAACVNLLPKVVSVFRWEGEVQRESECLLLLKTTADRVVALQEKIVALHPYELPEVLAVPVGAGLPGYLRWIEAETR